MTAPHFFAQNVTGDIVTLTGDEARHAARVLRITEGERITVSDGRGTVVDAIVTDARATLVGARVEARRTVAPGRPRVAVWPALPKTGKLDLVVQKLTELGVDAIHPWPAARTVVRWDAAKRAAHTERWRAIAREAAKQSRRAWIPEVSDPRAPAGLTGLTIVLHEEETSRLLQALPAEPPEEVSLIVGPEGGLTADEIASFRAQGALIAGLGDQILRFETAALIAPALLLGHFGRLG